MKISASIRFIAPALALLSLLLASRLLTGRKQIELYWMPYCPYGVQAMANILAAIDNESGECPSLFYIAIDKHKQPAASPLVARTSAGVHSGCQGLAGNVALASSDERFVSLHGSSEVDEGIRQVIISKLHKSQLIPYLKRFVSSPTEDWKIRCGSVGINPEEIERIARSGRGHQWYAENVEHARSNGITLSPTLKVDDETIPGVPKTPKEMRALLCRAGCLTKFCSDIRDLGQLRPDAVTAYLIVPDDCAPCHVFPLAQVLGIWADHLRINRISLSSPRAQELLGAVKTTSFPVLVIDAGVLKRTWGGACIRDLEAIPNGGGFFASLDWGEIPFQRYASIHYEENGLLLKQDHFTAALMLHRAGLLTGAAMAYRLSLLENPLDFRAWNNLGAILYDNFDMWQSGGTMFERAVALNSRYQPALENVARYFVRIGKNKELLVVKRRLGWLAIEQKKWLEAKKYFDSLLVDADSEFDSRKALAFIAVQEDDPQRALECLEVCLRINSNPDGDLANLLAGVHFRLGDNDKAKAWYLRSLAKNPNRQAYSNLCYLLRASNEWQQLLSIALKAEIAHPNESSYKFYQAQALVQLEREREAINVLEKMYLVADEGTRFRASYELALLYGEGANEVVALKYAGSFLEGASVRELRPACDELIRIGEIALKFEDFRMAFRAFEHAVQLRPSSVVAHKALAFCYQQQGKTEMASEHLTLAGQFGGNTK